MRSKFDRDKQTTRRAIVRPSSCNGEQPEVKES
jgi:hypothetical protein